MLTHEATQRAGESAKKCSILDLCVREKEHTPSLPLRERDAFAAGAVEGSLLAAGKVGGESTPGEERAPNVWLVSAPEGITEPLREEVAAFRARGHEFAVRVPVSSLESEELCNFKSQHDLYAVHVDLARWGGEDNAIVKNGGFFPQGCTHPQDS